MSAIDSHESREIAHQRLKVLIHSDPQEALRFAGELSAELGWQWAALELRGVAGIDGGQKLGDARAIDRGISLLKSAFPEPESTTAYNIANGQNALWELVLRQDGVVAALERERKNLHTARRTWESIGDDSTAEPGLRAQALVNAGNSYDNLGREQDGLRLYDQALDIVPEFAMAHGNRGIALSITLPFAAEHAHAVLAETAAALDKALANSTKVIEIGGASALRHFQEVRDRLPKDVPSHPHAVSDWSDPYLAWCRRHELFLHVSHACLAEDARLDPLMFQSLTGGKESSEFVRGDALVDGFNSLKRDYTAARYTLWLGLDRESMVASSAAALDRHVRLLETHHGTRWGHRTGMVIQAFAATTNLLDKIATLTHAFFRTGRKANQITFRQIWQSEDGKLMQSELAEAIEGDGWNPGLTALCDLANDLRDTTDLARFVALRHAATHRLLVVHELEPPASPDWLEREDWAAFAGAAVDQLQLARAALVYLVRAIDAHEHRLAEQRRDQVFVELPTIDVASDLSQLD